MTLQDPEARAAHALLGVSEHATEEELRAAYTRALRANPPDRAPEAFQRIREAYDFLRDPEIRFRSILDGDDPDMLLTEWLERHPAPRQFVGPRPWLAVIRSKA